ncbi:hypothetical protein Pan97_44830 [Bremerella volcania]|uniref:Uncharacterized protein n=1 Tax=Bremerella volcania TaxID=2527984 RepID=A0A518CDY4_9BACT|nr:hypothetical protein Pan97_44830 [Bremerella volcania]
MKKASSATRGGFFMGGFRCNDDYLPIDFFAASTT